MVLLLLTLTCTMNALVNVVVNGLRVYILPIANENVDERKVWSLKAAAWRSSDSRVVGQSLYKRINAYIGIV